MREWTPMNELPRGDAISAYYYQWGIEADFWVEDLSAGPYDSCYKLVRRAPWRKRFCGIKWEYKDNPQGNNLKEMIQVERAKRREQAKTQ